MEGLHILSISDTSEINLQAHRGRSKAEGLGVVGNNKDVGFFIHPTLAADAAHGFPLGLTRVQLWTRDPKRPDKQVRNYGKLPIEQSVAFCEEQQQCLIQLSPTLQGRTQKQQNPYPLASLPWATWFIARLGGWSAYRSQRPPGMPTLIHGLQRFEAIFIGWETALGGLVCTP